MKSPAGFLVEVIGAVLLVASIAAVGPALAAIMNGSQNAVGQVLEFIFLAIAGIVGFALGLFMHRIEALAGE